MCSIKSISRRVLYEKASELEREKIVNLYLPPINLYSTSLMYGLLNRREPRSPFSERYPPDEAPPQVRCLFNKRLLLAEQRMYTWNNQQGGLLVSNGTKQRANDTLIWLPWLTVEARDAWIRHQIYFNKSPSSQLRRMHTWRRCQLVALIPRLQFIVVSQHLIFF